MFASHSAQPQNISRIIVQNGSQCVVGSAGEVSFPGSKKSEDTIETAAKSCRDALFMTHPNVDRQELISAKGMRANGTCEWIKETDSYVAWKEGETSLLWIAGGPGKGKTMLSIFLTEDLEQEFSGDQTVQVAYHFCIHKKRDTGLSLLRNLLYQILDKQPELAKHVSPYFETSEATKQTLSSLDTLWVMFVKLITDPQLDPTFCVLDGFDECDEATRSLLLPRFVRQFKSQSSKIHTKSSFRLVIVSRHIDGLESCAKIDLDNDRDSNGGDDIRLFIHEKVRELFQERRFSIFLLTTVEETLLSGAGGTFLWVGFVVNELLKMRTWSQVHKQLKSLPTELSDLYGRMLLEIPSSDRKTSISILKWVCLAQRPLKLLELAEAVGLKPITDGVCSEELEFIPTSIFLERAAIDAIVLCGQILKIENKEVTLVHQSARDYLQRNEKDSNEVLEQYRIRSKETHFMLAQACFDCISRSDLRNTEIYLNTGSLQKHSPFLQYAVQHWREHIQSCHDLANNLFDNFGPFFENESKLRENWWKCYGKMQGLDIYTLPLMHIVSYLGVPTWIKTLLSRDESLSVRDHLNSKDLSGRTPLHWGVRGKSEETVTLLLEYEIDVNMRDESGETALWTAIRVKNEPIARRLIEKGADINARNANGFLIHTAVWSNDLKLVEFLIKKGIDFEAQNSKGNRALHEAIDCGRQEIVQLLLDSGANINAIGCKGDRALHRAIDRGHQEIVQLLLNSRADINAIGCKGRTPLHLLTRSGNKAMVQVLMAMGADIWVEDDNGVTLLHDAFYSGNEALVLLFVEKGLDVKAKTKDGETMLHRFASNTRSRNALATARFLIAAGVDVKTRSSSGRTALHHIVGLYYVDKSYHAATKLLIKHGAGVNDRDECGKTPSHYATYSPEGVESVMLLITNGADFEARDNDGRTPFDIAADCDDVWRDIVKHLVMENKLRD